MDGKTERDREEALRLKTLAEQKYASSSLKSALRYAKRAHRLFPTLDGLSEMLTALKILRVAAKSSAGDGGESPATLPDYYKVLQMEPFSHINDIKKRYKELALTLHPDKNTFAASEEAFKLVGEAFRVLSDKIRRKEYDMKLRIALQAAAMEVGCGGVPDMLVDAFWTACSTCRLLHQFEMKYLGKNLMCPSCKKSFNAVAVSDNAREEDIGATRSSARIRARGIGFKWKMSSVGEVLERSMPCQSSENSVANDELRLKRTVLPQKSKLKRMKVEEEKITLAQMQMMARRKMREEKMKLKGKENHREKDRGSEKAREKERHGGPKGGHIEDPKERNSENGDPDIMAVEDSDFYDFDKDRVERSFKKGQVWAVYDDDDGMPRRYGLVDEVAVYPFMAKLSWLDFQYSNDESLMCREKMGFHISCGRFRVARGTLIDSVNIFSHVVNAERAAREVYRIYPKKGSVWALYNEKALENSGDLVKNKRCYDIVVCLTSYSDIYGLSMAYLEKVGGFKTVFKRREVGSHAVKWFEKDDVRLYSHQIPARKLSGEEAPNLSKDCWELDPASLPPDLLTIDWHK